MEVSTAFEHLKKEEGGEGWCFFSMVLKRLPREVSTSVVEDLLEVFTLIFRILLFT